jgi:hypothetical protein
MLGVLFQHNLGQRLRALGRLLNLSALRTETLSPSNVINHVIDTWNAASTVGNALSEVAMVHDTFVV